MTDGRMKVCVVGAGPRGLSVVERICANVRRSAEPLACTVHLVDPAAPGAGRVWRTDQSRQLLMNTVASQVTMFTDSSVTMRGPVEPGPSLYEWARRLAAEASPDAPGGPEEEYGEATLAEAQSLGPDSYPTRAFYGAYLRWVLRTVVDGAPASVSVRFHRCRAVALDDAPDGQVVTLEGGARLTGLDAVVLAQGHVPARPDPHTLTLARFAADHGLAHEPPCNPADADLSAIRPGEPTLLIGLGLNAFDHIALLTEGRGGSFERKGDELVYLPSGREPQLYAGSRRGVPYHARGENEKGAYGRHEPRLLSPPVIARLRAAAEHGTPVDFRTDVWPLIAKEVESVYYGALLARRRGRAATGAFTARFLAAARGAEEDELLTRHGIGRGERWDWEWIERPYGSREFATQDSYREWLLEYVRQDVRAAREGNVSGPLKAALDVLRDLRNEVRLVVDHAGISGESYRDDLDGWYTPLNAFLSIGPPTQRIEEMSALIEAGVLDVLGPGLRVSTDPVRPAFVAWSARIPGHRVRVSALIEARLPPPSLRRTADPLLSHLLHTAQCRPYRIPGRGAEAYETDGLDVTDRPYRLIDAQGRAHPRRFAYGVPTEAVHWVTAAGIRPGVDSVTLGDADAIARAVLGLAETAAPAPLDAVGTGGPYCSDSRADAR
ncbi:FAD/NAD(P)-binding protein [Streptomyces olindensis]|uniref:FAD/NAD(P)-binding protein n=1 Tax=Streptomyces olindensis TaxID=358823 RepID=A0ABV2XP72_9ACTN